MATPQEYRMVEAALRQLDIVPQQVLIEASIIEVTLTDELRYGVEWFFKGQFDNHRSQTKLDLGDAGISALTPGFSYAVIDASNVVRGVLNALASESKINVLSSPSLMVLDNQVAKINVGDEVPIPTRQSTSNINPDAPTVNEIEYRDTGVLLEVTPRIGQGGLVTMEISQEVSDVATTTSSGIDAPTIRKRAIASTIAVQSGDSVVLGGLIRDTRDRGESGIPILYKVPVLGKLFGTTGDTNRRTELLVLITPRAVRNQSETLSVTEEFRSKLKGLEPAR
jgi:general secretion pathway protein D